MSKSIHVLACIGFLAAVTPAMGQKYLAGDSSPQSLVNRVGAIIGAATACQQIPRSRIKLANTKANELIKAVAQSPKAAGTLKALYEASLVTGQKLIIGKLKDCDAADKDLIEFDASVKTASVNEGTGALRPEVSPEVTDEGVKELLAPPAAAAVPAVPAQKEAKAEPSATAGAVTPSPAPIAAVPPVAVRGVTADEIRFGISAPFSGPSQELGQRMKIGIEAAFNQANLQGGVHGRKLRLIAADDGYEPERTAIAMKALLDTHQVFGIVGNVGTPTAAVALPFAMERRMLFFGAFTGANLLRREPPDRYVFNFRASYAEETDAAVRYLIKIKRLKPEQIAVFAQQDAYGDAGFSGVTRALRSLQVGEDNTILRLNYKRNTLDIEEAALGLIQSKTPIKAVVMVATYRAAAKFIARTRDFNAALIYTNVSFVGSSALANELMLIGPRYATGVIVTQVVPAIDSYSSATLEYKSMLAAVSPGEAPDYVSFEGYLSAKVLVEALRRTGPAVDTEKVVDALEGIRDLDIGLGAPISFRPSNHQALSRVWGTQLGADGRYQDIDLQ